MGKVAKPGTTGMYPLPVVLVTCVDENSKPNIITLSWAGVLCSEPPVVGVAIRPHRYSHGLITSSGEFVVNMPAEDILRETDICGVISGRDGDKFSLTGLTPVDASQVKAPLIKECPVNLECRTVETIRLGTHELILGEVLVTHIDEELLGPNGRIRDILEAKPVAYSSLTAEYLSLGSIIGRYGFSRAQEQDL